MFGYHESASGMLVVQWTSCWFDQVCGSNLCWWWGDCAHSLLAPVIGIIKKDQCIFQYTFYNIRIRIYILVATSFIQSLRVARIRRAGRRKLACFSARPSSKKKTPLVLDWSVFLTNVFLHSRLHNRGYQDWFIVSYCRVILNKSLPGGLGKRFGKFLGGNGK